MRPVGLVESAHLADLEAHLAGRAQLVHAGHVGRRRAKAVAPVHQRDASGLVVAGAREVERPIERRIAAADDDDVLAREHRRVAHAVKELRVAMPLDAFDLQCARLERADAAGDEEGLGNQAGAAIGFDIEAAVVALAHDAHFLAEVEVGLERRDLLEQALGQFAARAHRHRRNVVDRLVGVQLDALAASVCQRIDHMSFDLQQPQLEHLKQPHRASADDHGIGFDRAVGRGRDLRNRDVGFLIHGCVAQGAAPLSGSAATACPCDPSTHRRRRAPPCAW